MSISILYKYIILRTSENSSYLIIAILTSLYLFLVFQNGWVTDDAFISFRVVHNFLNGYGLKWNVDERVQVFTNPLWTLIHIPVYPIIKNIYFTTITISFVFSCAAFITAALVFKKERIILIFSLFLPIAISIPFLEFSTSGLENPLTFFLIAIFCYHLFSERRETGNIKWLIFIASLAALNRMDTLILFLPAVFAIFILEQVKNKIRTSLIWSTPITLWLFFSLFYYGFPFPNTKYAKLNTGISHYDYMVQGFLYQKDLFTNHMSTAAIIVVGLIVSLSQAINFSYWGKNNLKRSYTLFLGMGVLLYCLYVTSVGGDFMTGRLWTAPFFLSLLTICISLKYLDGELRKFKFVAALTILTIICHLATYYTMQNKNICIRASGIANERLCYEFSNSLANNIRENKLMTHGFAIDGINAREKSMKEKYAVIRGTIGMTGFFGGPAVIIIDLHRLSDPLLARLKYTDPKWRIGHFLTRVPDGYEHARITGDTSRMNPDLANYYIALRYITSGPLFSWQRIKTIIEFNLGYYDSYLDKYEKSKP